MSGICAIFYKDGAQPAARRIAATAASLCVFGGTPAAADDGPAGVGAGAKFESQQIHRSERVLLACDADLLNGPELDELLPSRVKDAPPAARFAGLYERFGPDFVERLRGGFSVLIWDRVERQIVAAIDGFGIKRLAYHDAPGMFAAATRIDALTGGAGVRFEMNPRAIPNLLNYSVNLGPETIAAGIQRLAPGTILVASEKRLTFSKYWDMRYGAGSDSDEDRLSGHLESVVQDSVARHFDGMPGAKTGAFLSGGTDSSTVVGMMRRKTPRGAVKAFSIGYQESEFNELAYAEIAARRFEADHKIYLVGADDCFEAIPDMVRSFDEPFGNSSAIATYFCARLAAQNGVRTLLAGDGGDELFGGNEWYLIDRIFEAYHSVPRALRGGLIEPLLKMVPGEWGVVGKAKRYVRRARLSPVDRVLSFQFLYEHPPREVFDGDFLASLGDYSVGETPARHYNSAAAEAHLDRVLYMDMKIVLADSDLPKVTLMSELAGVQPRFPFLDRAVAEFSGRIPPGLKVKGTQKRYLFKRAFRNLLPAEIIAKKKHGFGIPVADWLKSDRRMRELLHDSLNSQKARERGYFHKNFIEDMVARHENDPSAYYGDTIWTLLVLELWHRQYVDAPMSVAV